MNKKFEISKKKRRKKNTSTVSSQTKKNKKRKWQNGIPVILNQLVVINVLIVQENLDCKKIIFFIFILISFSFRLFLNIIDFCIGCVLFTFGIYLRIELGNDENMTSQLVGYVAIIVGLLLLIVAFLSLCAISISSCRCAIIPSGYLAILTAIGALITGIVLLARKKKLFDYLNEHQDEIGLDDNDISTLERWAIFIVYSSFFEFVSSIIRFFSSKSLYLSLRKVDGAYESLLDEETKIMDEKIDQNRENINAKYDGLREHYRNKYNRKEETP